LEREGACWDMRREQTYRLRSGSLLTELLHHSIFVLCLMNGKDRMIQ